MLNNTRLEVLAVRGTLRHWILLAAVGRFEYFSPYTKPSTSISYAHSPRPGALTPGNLQLEFSVVRTDCTAFPWPLGTTRGQLLPACSARVLHLNDKGSTFRHRESIGSASQHRLTYNDHVSIPRDFPSLTTRLVTSSCKPYRQHALTCNNISASAFSAPTTTADHKATTLRRFQSQWHSWRDSRRQTSASILGREPPPSKDGTAQMNAKEVEGLKDYQLGNCVGRGAFGSVYRALNWSTGETVAIKQIRLADLPKAELNVIMQEIDLLKNLNHPNIVKYHGFVKSKESLYIILEYCENGSLHSICKNFGKFPENLVSLYTAQVLQGLLFLHEQGVIHRDIKGANILTTKEGLVKLADFGVATKQSGLSEGSVVGTPYWMAPEVIELSGASTASDIWSLGCTVIELLDGKPPYHRFAPMPALFRIVNDDHPPLPEGVSPLVRDFLMQCFQKDPNLRVTAKKLLRHPWIMSTKKGDKKKAPEHTEAVKSVKEWNQALKASPPNLNTGVKVPPTRPTIRPASRSGVNGLRKTREAVPTGSVNATQSRGPRKIQSSVVASPPSENTNDRWDDDFEALSTGLGSLQIPDRLRPQDNFAGLFSSERLKQYATLDSTAEHSSKVEEWEEDSERQVTVRSSVNLAEGVGHGMDSMRTFRTPHPAGHDSHPDGSSGSHVQMRRDVHESKERRGSKDSQPQTQILRLAQKPKHDTKGIQITAAISSRPTLTSTTKYREDLEEDYSDLVADDEVAFKAKLAGFSPNRPIRPSELRNLQSKLGSNSRRRTQTPTDLVHDAAAIRRTRSSLEIQKYREDVEDDDFTELCFDEADDVPMNLQPKKTRSPQSATTSSESLSSDRGALKFGAASSWPGEDDEDDVDDPFAALEEELDAVDLESNVARDKHARLCALVENLVSDLKLSQPDDILAEIVEQLLQILA
nr:cytokinesis protein seph [Quercus suber]